MRGNNIKTKIGCNKQAYVSNKKQRTNQTRTPLIPDVVHLRKDTSQGKKYENRR